LPAARAMSFWANVAPEALAPLSRRKSVAVLITASHS